MKIGVVVSFNDAYSDMARISVFENILHYCKINGYDLYLDKQSSSRMNRGGAWNKIIACIEALPNYDWIFFIDVDCLFMNHSIKLEDLIDDSYSFIVPTHKVPAIDNPILNHFGDDCVITSQFFVKNNEIGMSILEDIWEAKEWPEGMDINTFDHEGRQVRITINKDQFKSHVKIIDEGLLNKFWYVNNPFIVNHNKGVNNNVWQSGDFIIHVTNYPIKERINLLDNLNFFSGGLISCFLRQKNLVKVSPLIELKDVEITISNLNNEVIFRYFFPEMTYKLQYILYTNDEVDTQEIFVKSYSNGSLISQRYLPCKN